MANKVLSLLEVLASGVPALNQVSFDAYKMLKMMIKGLDNGDGTLTLLREITVPKEWLDDGRDVVAVRAPKGGELYVDAVTGAMCVDPLPGYHRCLRVIMSDARPQFREGGYYRTLGYGVVGPLCQLSDDTRLRKWACTGWVGWFADGRVCSDGTKCNGDLIPGEVTVWQQPVSLKVGEYWWDGMSLTVFSREDDGLGKSEAELFFSDWTDPPKPGRYRVPGGGKIATWEGE